MKYVIIFAALFAISGCVEEGENLTEDFTSVCIDNVQYWHSAVGSQGYLAPRIDPFTLTFMNCEN